MDVSRLKLKDLIDIKFDRLLKPKFLQTNIPLSGSYNSLESLSSISTAVGADSLRTFNLVEPSSPSLQNLTYVTGNPAKLIGDPLVGLFVFKNRDTADISVRELIIKLSLKNPVHNSIISEKTLVNNKNTFFFDKFFSQKVEIPSDQKAICELEVIIKYSSEQFKKVYNKYKERGFVSDKGEDYYLDGRYNVVKVSSKKFKYEAKEPFFLEVDTVCLDFQRQLFEFKLFSDKKSSLFLEKIVVDKHEVPVGEHLVEKETVSKIVEADYSAVSKQSYLSLFVYWTTHFDSEVKIQEIRFKNDNFNPFFSIRLLNQSKKLEIDKIQWIELELNSIDKGLLLKRRT